MFFDSLYEEKYIFVNKFMKHCTIVTTEAIVLKAMKYGDTSKIVTFFTKEFGKVSAIAKGARGKKSKFGSALEPLSYVSLVLYKKDARSLQLISECSYLQYFGRTSNRLESLSTALSIMEMLYCATHEEKNEPLFYLVIESLNALQYENNNASRTLLSFQLHFAAMLGFRFQLEHCPMCQQTFSTADSGNKQYSLELHRGGLLCHSCSKKISSPFFVSAETLSTLRVLLNRNFHNITEQPLTLQTEKEIANVLNNYLRIHIEGFRALRSEQIFKGAQPIVQ
ncbi:MAG: DNA repair protein RecO [Ignavibacteria bacterium]|nr:DNA repair protein RecO [Ignavibacteria bacterium]